MHKAILSLSIFFLAFFVVLPANVLAGTTVPGHSSSKYDQDNNGFSDAGVYVNGKYPSVYAYDTANWYWDLGDGRVLGTVASIADLDEATLTTCNYVNIYRADFGNDAFMNTGWIQNHITCSGYDDNNTYNYFIVEQNDPKYTGDGIPVWGTWEYKALTQSGFGNLANPHKAV